MQVCNLLITNRLSRAICLALLFSLSRLVTVGQTTTYGQIQALPPGQMFERKLTGDEAHRYQFHLAKDEFFQARVEQKGVDVILKIKDASGTVLASMDSPNGKQGPETLSFVAEKTGSYVLEVSGLDPKTEQGDYSIQRTVSHPATPMDKRRAKVERLFVAGMNASGAEGQEETAVQYLSEAQVGWAELADGHMAGLTAQQVVSLLFRGYNKQLKTANDLIREGQTLAAGSRSNSPTAKAKFQEALSMCHDLREKLDNKTLLEKINRLGAPSEARNQLSGLQFSSKWLEGISLSGIAHASYILGEFQEHVDYSKLSLIAYEDAIKLLSTTNLPDQDKKKPLLSLNSAVLAGAFSVGSTFDAWLGKPEEALEYLNLALEQARVLYEETHDPRFRLSEALALRQVGTVYTKESKDRKKSIEFLSKAIEVYRTLTDKRTEIANLLVLIGSQYSVDYDFEAASKNWAAALEIYRELDDKAGQMTVLQFKGAMYYLLDNKPKVRETLTQALSILESPAYLESYKKQLPQALRESEALTQLNDTVAERFRLGWIGLDYSRLEDYEKAIAFNEKALALSRANNDLGGIRSDLVSIGLVYTKLEKWDKAHEYYEQAVEISRGRNFQEILADDLADAGWTLLELGKLQEALKHQNEALALYQSVGVSAKNAFSTRYSSLLAELGRTHAALGNRSLAIFFGKQAVNAVQDERKRLRRNFDVEAQKGFLAKKEKHYRQLADWLIADGRLPEAEEVLRMLKEDEYFRFVRRDATEVEKLSQRTTFKPDEVAALNKYNEVSGNLAALGAKYARLKEKKNNLPKGKQLPELEQQELAVLTEKIQQANAGFQLFLRQLAEEFANTPKAVKVREDTQQNSGLRADLNNWRSEFGDEGVVALYTVVGEDRYRVILTTPDVQTDGKSEIKAEELHQKIAAFRQAVQNPAIDPRPLGKELYDIIVKPIEKQLVDANAKTLLWSLDNTLRYVPIAALWDGKQYFGERYQNVIITLASRTRLSEKPNANWRVLGLGVSEAKQIDIKDLEGTTRAINFRALPGVRIELQTIVRDETSRNKETGILPGRRLLDATFTEVAFKENLGERYKVIHIASHFSFQPSDLRNSFLLLGDGSALTLESLKNSPDLAFTGVDLLTLSACDTAVGEARADGVEVESFGVIAQETGAKSVLATLWSVADKSTQVLMSEFYRLRKANPRLSKAAALQLAQRKLIAGNTQRSFAVDPKRSSQLMKHPINSGGSFSPDPNKPYAHPYYWSPFVLIGNWR